MAHDQQGETADTRGMHTQFAVFGTARLLGGSAVLGAVALLVGWDGVQIAPALLLGGVAGLALALLPPGVTRRPVATLLGLRVGPSEAATIARTKQLRRPWWAVLASVPFLAAVSAYLLTTDEALVRLDTPRYAFAAFFGGFHIWMGATGAQFLQVARALRGERERVGGA